MTMNVRKWIECRWIILFAWYNRSYCFRRKALRHLISFTTLNKFYDPSIKKNCKEHCVWTVLICFDRKSDHSTTPLTDGRCKNIFTALGFCLCFWVWRPESLRAAAVTIQNIAIGIFCGCGVFWLFETRIERRHRESRWFTLLPPQIIRDSILRNVVRRNSGDGFKIPFRKIHNSV